MKWIYCTLPVLLLSCVSYKQYKSSKNDLALILEENKNMRKEVTQLKKWENKLLDTIRQRAAAGNLAAAKLTKKLESYKIKVKLGALDFGGLRIEIPDSDPEYSRSMFLKLTNRDTNSAKNISWLSKNEKQIYYYLNYARLNPKEFCNRFVLPKLEYDSNNVYLLTLVDYMNTMMPRNAITPDKEQFDAAQCHAISSGKLGYVGHTRQSDKCKSRFYGECCSYGVSDPLGVVLQLLIDSGVKSLGHRYICLGWYEKGGISIAPHTAYGTNVVLDFR